MDGKIIYLGQTSTLSENYHKALTRKFTVERVPITAKGLYKEFHDIECIVIYTTGLGTEEYDVIGTFLGIFPEGYLPAVIIGDKVSNNIFRQVVHYPLEKILDVQSQSIDLICEIGEIVGKHTATIINKPTVYVFDTISKSLSAIESILSSEYNVIRLRSIGEATRALSHRIPEFMLFAKHSLDDRARQLFVSFDLGDIKNGSRNIIYGPPISSEEFEEISYLSPQMYILESSNGADFLKYVNQHFHQNITNESA